MHQLHYYTYYSGTTNIYVDVDIKSSKSAVCTFSKPQLQGDQLGGVKLCSIKYGRCQQLLTVGARNQSVDANTNSVELFLLTELKNGDCYFLNASNGTFTVLQWKIYRKSVSNTSV